jgi:hypothetical protein
MSVSEIRAQRDQALACLILAVCIALAVFISVFGDRDRSAIDSAHAAVAVHEGLLRQSAENLKTNQDALYGVRAALGNLERARQK